MGGKFEIFADKHCWKLADRLSVTVIFARLELLVGRLADPWCYGWGRQLLGCCRPRGGTTSTQYRRRDAVLAATHESHGAYTYRPRLWYRL